MTPRGTIRRIALLLASIAVLFALPVAAAPAAAAATGGAAAGDAAAGGTGWIRLAHLSPDMPATDVYLYSFGNPDARFVLHHVAYGTVSAYQTVPAGDYSIAMRMAGATATSQPVLSASVTITAGHAYTAAAIGPQPGLRLQVLDDDLTTPAGKALVRVVQASLKDKTVTVSWDGHPIAAQLTFPAVTSYQAVSPGSESVTVRDATGTASSAVTLTAGSVHTLVVLDGGHGLEIANLEDAAGSTQMPAGGAATGFGGTAAHGPGPAMPWLVIIGAGALLCLAALIGCSRPGARPWRQAR
jgi:Domain of unknown function (DUF4397)